MTQFLTRPLAIRAKTLDFWLFNVAVPLTFWILAQAFIPMDQIFQVNSDEGIELIKSDLYRDGYQLYTQVWNDQPPLPTVLWTAWLQWVGHTVAQARHLTLLFATLLVWAFGQSVRMTVGKWPALLGILWLTATSYFLQLSTSVMMGQPSLAMVMTAVYALLQFQQSLQWGWLVCSGLLFAIALQLKSFVAFLVPVFIIALWLPIRGGGSRRLQSGLLRIGVWLVALGIAFGMATVLLPPQNLDQTVGGHFNRNLEQAYGWVEDLPDFFEMFIHDPDFWILCGFSAWASNQWLQRFPLFPKLWLVFALLTLWIHRPIWYHYYALISIPLVWLTAYAARELYGFVREALKGKTLKQALRDKRTATVAGFLCLSLVAIPIKYWVTFDQNQLLLKNSVAFQQGLEQIMAERDRTRWLFTDVPIYGFYANLKVPPETAVFSSKRIESGNLTPAQLNEIVDRYRPEQIALGRFKSVRRALQSNLDRHYDLKYMNQRVRIYRRRAAQKRI
ncbi:MAG TPA: glycosyltransferase family 39 protein [Stenomitos sp.]